MSTAAVSTGRAKAGAVGLPWYVVAVVLAATSAIVGVIWDISWHRTIGRDTFWTPAHLAIYLGGALAGAACGWLGVRLAAFVAGILGQNVAVLGIEQIACPHSGHHGLYYKVAGAAFPVAVAAAAGASRVRWGATAAAAAYMAISLVMIWILQLFPATPKLAPVFNPVTHMVAPPFPLLLVVPAVALDLLVQRFGPGRDWWVAVLAGAVFVGVFLATQWLFSEFLLTPHARTFFFGVDQWDYSSRLGPWRYRFWRIEGDPVTASGLAWGAVFAIASARLGLWWGNWMARVRR